MRGRTAKQPIRFLTTAAALLCMFANVAADSTGISLAFPVYSQYLHNGLAVNPAYSGTRGALSAFVSGEKRWMGVAGAPQRQTVSLHSPFINGRDAAGILAQFMQYGFTKTTSLYGSYAHSIDLKSGKLSFGLKAGVDMAGSNFSGIETVQPDAVFAAGDKPWVLPNIGAGVYYYSRRLFAGLAVPQFMSYRKSPGHTVQAYHRAGNYDFVITGGGLVDIGTAVKFKPSFLLQYSPDRSEKVKQFDISGNFILANCVWLGASYRTSEKALVGIAQLQLNRQLMVGLSYDYPTGFMHAARNGSAELCLRYEFGTRISAANPRYF
ncbi:MAG: PorP/SprF family type IX secretion system membrane protein [Bacteroidales bacterium]|nr:PorP/SprF family type IX secretion system membrane protein [Bacteroidales bacterium]